MLWLLRSRLPYRSPPGYLEGCQANLVAIRFLAATFFCSAASAVLKYGLWGGGGLEAELRLSRGAPTQPCPQ